MADLQRSSSSADAPSVTFLFTDIEGSSRLWEHDEGRMSPALAAHDTLSRQAVESRGGTVVKMTGDGMYAVFDDPRDALAATLDVQHALADPCATCGVALRLRCALHCGVVERRDNDYFGSPVNRAARIMSAAHGGQVLVSQALVDRLHGLLPTDVSLRDLGNVRLKDLAKPEHVYQLVDARLQQDFPALRSLESTPNNLPQQLTSFIGRRNELAHLKRLLPGARLLTLTGSGGCGKTRLALQLVADALEQFPDGAWFVELAPLSNRSLVPQAVAKVLSLREEPEKSTVGTIVDHLQDKRAVLLLDNCEHVLDACAQLAEAIARHCPGAKIVASSREPLGIAGEQTYRVPSLSLPAPKQARTAASVAPFEAVQLFVDRARLVHADFELTDHNASTLTSICARLDGIPLAIELAAARARSLSIEEIERRLDQRFRLLTGGSRTALPRQQTLRSLIDWSYDLLNDPAKLLLRRLSVFSGGWLLEAAEKVCAGDGLDESEIFDVLSALADKSLVLSDVDDRAARFRLVETVRQYAMERLSESGSGEPVRERHLSYFLSLAEEAEPKLLGPGQGDWLRRLEGEHDNLRAALEWSVAGTRSEAPLRLCGALQRFWLTHGHLAEGRDWCERVLGAAEAGAPSLERAKVLNAAGVLAYHQLDYDGARRRHEESLAIREQLGDRKGVAISLNNLGMVALDQGDLASARVLHERSLAIARELGNRNGAARSLGNLAMIASEQGDLSSARRLLEESLAILRDLGDRDGVAIGLHLLGQVAAKQADRDAAVALFRESLEILRGLGHKGRIFYSLEELAALVASGADTIPAARLWGAAQRLREDLGARASTDATYTNAVAAAREMTHDPAAFERAWQEGRAMSLDQAIELALRVAGATP